MNAAALCAAIEFGLQPVLFHSANGTPLYAPFHLAQTIPAMALAHLTVAGAAEFVLTAGIVAYLQRANLPLLRINHPGIVDTDAELAAAERATGAALGSDRDRDHDRSLTARPARARRRFRRGRAGGAQSAQVRTERDPERASALQRLLEARSARRLRFLIGQARRSRLPALGDLGATRRRGRDLPLHRQRPPGRAAAAELRRRARRDRRGVHPSLAAGKRDRRFPILLQREAPARRRRREDAGRAGEGGAPGSAERRDRDPRRPSPAPRRESQASECARPADRCRAGAAHPGTARPLRAHARPGRRVADRAALVCQARLALHPALQRGDRGAGDAQLRHAGRDRAAARALVRARGRADPAGPDRGWTDRLPGGDVDLAGGAPDADDFLAAAARGAAHAAGAAAARAGARDGLSLPVRPAGCRFRDGHGAQGADGRRREGRARSADGRRIFGRRAFWQGALAQRGDSPGDAGARLPRRGCERSSASAFVSSTRPASWPAYCSPC